MIAHHKIPLFVRVAVPSIGLYVFVGGFCSSVKTALHWLMFNLAMIDFYQGALAYPADCLNTQPSLSGSSYPDLPQSGTKGSLSSAGDLEHALELPGNSKGNPKVLTRGNLQGYTNARGVNPHVTVTNLPPKLTRKALAASSSPMPLMDAKSACLPHNDIWDSSSTLNSPSEESVNARCPESPRGFSLQATDGGKGRNDLAENTLDAPPSKEPIYLSATSQSGAFAHKMSLWTPPPEGPSLEKSGLWAPESATFGKRSTVPLWPPRHRARIRSQSSLPPMRRTTLVLWEKPRSFVPSVLGSDETVRRRKLAAERRNRLELQRRSKWASLLPDICPFQAIFFSY